MIKRFLVISALSITLSGCLPSAVTKDQKGNDSGSEFLKGAVAPGFPALPQYPESIIIESVTSGESYGASFMSEDSLEKVVQFYTDSLPALGWESQLAKRTEENFEFNVKNPKHEGVILVNLAADGSKVAITYSFSPR